MQIAMRSVLIVFGVIYGVNPYVKRKLSCGVDNSKTSVLYEGITDIHIYPWMGTLFYPFGKKKLTTSVVLVTKQVVIGAADEIDSLPKVDVRARSRVVLGHNCSGPSIRIRDYAFHPDYKSHSYTALAMIQLDVDTVQQELRPICSPPAYFAEPKIYAMVNGDCRRGKVRVYKMEYVPDDKCEQFYRKSGLGYGVNGPGCEAPARFLDYGMHQQWVRNSIARIGKPAITRMADNHIIMRRTLNNLQRYGDCDKEEQRYVIYRDTIVVNGDEFAKATYNLTLFADVEYSCIIMVADIPPDSAADERSQNEDCDGEPETKQSKKPKIYLRQWCAGVGQMCFGFQYIEINLYVHIQFAYHTIFHIVVYGKEGKVMDPQKGMQYGNSQAVRIPARGTKHDEVIVRLIAHSFKYTDPFHRWFYAKDIQNQ